MAIEGLWPNSLKNSTDKLLGAGATFTGEAEAISVTEQPQSVSVTVFSNTEGELQLQQSADGTNWDLVKKYTAVGNKLLVVEHNLCQRYFRVVYHTSYGQGYFRLQTRFNITRVNEVDPDKAASTQVAYNGEFIDQDRAADVQVSHLELLQEILTELRLNNLYLAKLADENYKPEDIE